MSIGRVPGATGIQPTIVDAKGDLIAATAADSVSRLVVGADETRLVAASGEATGLKYVADTTNYAIAAKGDLLAGTAADTVAALTVGANDTVLTADSSTATGLKWAAPASGGMTLLSTTTLTGATTTISGISGAYNELYVIVFGMTNATNSQEIWCNVNSVTTGVYYEGVRSGAVTSKLNTNISFGAGTDILRTGGNNAAIIRIQSYAATTYYKPMQFSSVYVDQASITRGATGSGGIATNSAITSLQFDAQGGDFTGGTVLIYGVK